MSFKVIPIDPAISQKVRATGMSSFGKIPASTAVATGYGPCRSCLKTFNEGREQRTAFIYDAFKGLADLPLPGPVFIHTDACEPYTDDGFPAALRQIPMLFEPFDAGGNMLGRTKAEADKLESQIEQIFADRNTQYIYLRNAEAGCFIARIERKTLTKSMTFSIT